MLIDYEGKKNEIQNWNIEKIIMSSIEEKINDIFIKPEQLASTLIEIARGNFDIKEKILTVQQEKIFLLSDAVLDSLKSREERVVAFVALNRFFTNILSITGILTNLTLEHREKQNKITLNYKELQKRHEQTFQSLKYAYELLQLVSELDIDDEDERVMFEKAINNIRIGLGKLSEQNPDL